MLTYAAKACVNVGPRDLNISHNFLRLHFCFLAHAESLPHDERKAYAEKVKKYYICLMTLLYNYTGGDVILEGN